MTVETYVEAVHRFARYAESQGDHRCRRRFPTLIRGWLAAMTDAGNSDGTRFNRFNGLKGFLKWAVADGQPRSNPIDRIAPSPSRRLSRSSPTTTSRRCSASA
jgi:site-specific recombinase XerD